MSGFLGATVALMPQSGLVLDPEDTAQEMVCAELTDPQLVERDVALSISAVAGTAGKLELSVSLVLFRDNQYHSYQLSTIQWNL